MPRKSDSIEETTASTDVSEVLVPFSVIIDGQDMTFMARDQEHLNALIAKFRSPTQDGQ